MFFDINKAQEKIQKEIISYDFGQEPPALYEPIRYILGLGGKRLRPLLTLFSCYLYSEDISKAVKPSLAVEVFHNFTLMHDDIMDKAPLRRNKPTVHEKWNSSTAILSGDVMLVKAYDLLMEADDKILRKLITLFNKCASEVCEGQQLDMLFESREKVTEEEYLNMIRLKTAVLLGYSLEAGALIGGAGDKDAQLLKNFGVSIGMAFQLKDDLLDVYGNQEKFGKKVGGDIISNKKTFLLIKALETAKGETLKSLTQQLNNAKNEEEKVEKVTEIYNKLDIKSVTEGKIDMFFNEGLKFLSKANAPLYKKNILKEYALQLMGREN